MINKILIICTVNLATHNYKIKRIVFCNFQQMIGQLYLHNNIYIHYNAFQQMIGELYLHNNIY